MKKISSIFLMFFPIILIMILTFTRPADAGVTWETQSTPYYRHNDRPYEHGRDQSEKYKGRIDDDGYTRARDRDGNTLRGHIDQDGYGRLRDQNGKDYRVTPR